MTGTLARSSITSTAPALRGGACLIVLSCGLLASGCLMTASDGESFDETTQRIEQLEAQSRQDRADLEAKLKELQVVLDQATEVLKRGSADVGAQVEQMRVQIDAACRPDRPAPAPHRHP